MSYSGTGGILMVDKTAMKRSPEPPPPLDPQALIEAALPERTDRKAKTIWLSESVVAEFEAACSPARPARVLEQMMADFVRRKRAKKD